MTADRKALDVDALAQEIRRVDGSHSLGAGALAEALMPFLAALTEQEEAGAVAWRVTVNTHDYITPLPSQAESWRKDGHSVEPLYTRPAPAPVTAITKQAGAVGVKVKALEWSNVPALGGQRKLVAQGCLGNEFARLDMRITTTNAEIEAFKSSKQADYEARILSALDHIPDAGKKVEPAPVNGDVRELEALEAIMENVDPATWPGLSVAHRCALGRFAKPTAASPPPASAVTEAPEPLYGPATHVCWTPDAVPVDQRRKVVLLDAEEYREFAALTAARLPASTEGWRDISTAPKDGTRVLLFWKDGSLAGQKHCGEYCIQQAPAWEGWVEPYDGSDFPAPSGWMPLPTSPTTDQGGE